MPTSYTPTRKDYLRKRLAGIDIDDFSQDVARLALTLADVPNANGWDLECCDMFEDDILKTALNKADIVLANPPFEAFPASDRTSGSSANKALEVFRQTLNYLPHGGIFGFVLPQSFLSSKEGKNIRRRMFDDCEIKEITLFADKVFEFGQPESVILLGHRPTRLNHIAFPITYQRVREQQISIFKNTYEPSTKHLADINEFTKTEEVNCQLPLLPELWNHLSTHPNLKEIALVGQGFSFKGAEDPSLPQKGARQSRKKFKGSIPGYLSVNDKEVKHTHGTPLRWWFNLSKEYIAAPRSGTDTGKSQILLNYARISRSEWKLKAIIDSTGHAVTSRIIAIRPNLEKVSLLSLWALLNSPIANAYASSVSSKRDILVGNIRKLPIPNNFNCATTRNLDEATKVYLDAARAFDEELSLGIGVEKDDLFNAAHPNRFSREEAENHLMYLHWRVDAELLKLYQLPPFLERQLLDMFFGTKRNGVPFNQNLYFPKHFTDIQTLQDLLSITDDWEKTSTTKTKLIEKKISGTASKSDLRELSRLKSLTEARGELFSPLPLEKLQNLQKQLQVAGQLERLE